ncbi:MAG: hypothetical protein R8M45_00040 [Ghiorsea sp.]
MEGSNPRFLPLQSLKISLWFLVQTSGNLAHIGFKVLTESDVVGWSIYLDKFTAEEQQFAHKGTPL